MADFPDFPDIPDMLDADSVRSVIAVLEEHADGPPDDTDDPVRLAIFLLTYAYLRVPAPPRDPRPHSRACGFRVHDHGTACHRNCPTCHGQAS